MRHEVDVRVATARSLTDVWPLAADVDSWPTMPGAELGLASTVDQVSRSVRYRIVSGLPVRDHQGEVTLEASGHGGTEVHAHESFRARIWGTGGYLRGRRERALVDLVRSWTDVPPEDS